MQPKEVKMQEHILKDILSTLQGIRNSIAEISGKFEAHSLNSYEEQLELRRELRRVKEELQEQTPSLNTLAEEVTDFGEN